MQEICTYFPIACAALRATSFAASAMDDDEAFLYGNETPAAPAAPVADPSAPESASAPEPAAPAAADEGEDEEMEDSDESVRVPL